MFNITFDWIAVTEIRDELRKLNENLSNIYEVISPPKASIIRFYVDEGGSKRRVKHMFLKVNQSLPVTITITDKFGNAAKVDGVPAWAVTDAALASLTVADDGMSASVVPVGAVGAFKVQVSADADLGEGVKSIMGELDVELLAGDAEVISIAAGEPV